MNEFARQLIECEQKCSGADAGSTPLAMRVSEKLRPTLSTLMGKMGYYALLGRALGLAQGETPALKAIRVTSEGKLEGWTDLTASVPNDERKAANVILIAQLLGLMVAFIGEDLTRRLLRQLWHNLPPDTLDLKNRD